MSKRTDIRSRAASETYESVAQRQRSLGFDPPCRLTFLTGFSYGFDRACHALCHGELIEENTALHQAVLELAEENRQLLAQIKAMGELAGPEQEADRVPDDCGSDPWAEWQDHGCPVG